MAFVTNLPYPLGITGNSYITFVMRLITYVSKMPQDVR